MGIASRNGLLGGPYVRPMTAGIWRAGIRYGFVEIPDLATALKQVKGLDPSIDVDNAIYFRDPGPGDPRTEVVPHGAGPCRSSPSFIATRFVWSTASAFRPPMWWKSRGRSKF
jgi:hypothetical protein